MTPRSPAADAFSETFYRYVAAGELRLPRCTVCGGSIDLAERVCPSDGVADFEWHACSGRAVLYSFVVYRRQYLEDFPVPYIVALVDLEEGQRLVSTVIGRVPEVGMSLTATFDDAGRLVFCPSTG